MSEVSTSNETLPPETDDGNVESGSIPDDTDESSEPVTESLPLDQVFGILKNQRRRHVLKYLHESDGSVSLSEVAEQIAAWENDKDIRQITSSERKRVYVGLYQCHLPKMDEVDVVSFNKPRGVIELGPNADALYRYLDTDDEADEAPRHVHSVVLSLASAFVLGTALLADALTTLPVVNFAVAAAILGFLGYSVASVS